MRKRKVSFNIDNKLFDDIQSYCDGRDIKMSDFFRDASFEKLEKEKSKLIILIPYNGKIEKFEINATHYTISLWEASEAMIENVGAVLEGTIAFPELSTVDMSVLSEREHILNEMLKPTDYNPNGVLSFYTTERYQVD